MFQILFGCIGHSPYHFCALFGLRLVRPMVEVDTLIFDVDDTLYGVPVSFLVKRFAQDVFEDLLNNMFAYVFYIYFRHVF